MVDAIESVFVEHTRQILDPYMGHQNVHVVIPLALQKVERHRNMGRGELHFFLAAPEAHLLDRAQPHMALPDAPVDLRHQSQNHIGQQLAEVRTRLIEIEDRRDRVAGPVSSVLRFCQLPDRSEVFRFHSADDALSSEFPHFGPSV